jgi:hypothetical protein
MMIELIIDTLNCLVVACRGFYRARRLPKIALCHERISYELASTYRLSALRMRNRLVL